MRIVIVSMLTFAFLLKALLDLTQQLAGLETLV